MKFTSREAKIIISLQTQGYPLKALATNYNVSTKTIKADIQSINMKIADYNSEITIKANIVEFISIYPPVHWRNIVKLNQSIDEENLILLKLLFKDDYIAMSDFAAELFISKSKLEKLLSSTPSLNTYVTKKRNVGIAINLDDKQKIKLAISVLLPYVDDLNYLVTARSLVQQLTDQEIKLEDFNISVQQFNRQVEQIPNITDQECKILILLILIGEHLLGFDQAQITAIITDYINVDPSNQRLKAIINNEIIRVLNSNNITDIDSLNLQRLTMHIEKVTLKHYPNTIEPAMEMRLKTEYSYAYSIATLLYNSLCTTLCVDIMEYEICYITLYIQTMLAKSREIQKLNILIVCQYGMSVSHYIQTWIERNVSVPINFKVSSVLNYWQISNPSNNYDLIITTIDNLESECPNIIKVDTIPLEAQLTEVKQKILTVQYQKQINVFFNNNTLSHINIENIDEIYPIIKKDLNQANPQFMQAMQKRTKEGLSNVNGVIIMHSDGTLISENKLLIYKLEQPISYDHNQVKMIFVFAFTTDFVEQYNGVIKQIYRIIYSEQYVQALYEAKTDQQFMWIFRNQIKEK